MITTLKKFHADNNGQGVMEYLIITSLVGIICLVTVQQFGKSIKTRIKHSKEKIEKYIK